MYFCVLLLSTLLLPVKVMVVWCCASPSCPQKSCQGFWSDFMFCMFYCEESSSLKSVFVEPFVGILKCMLKKTCQIVNVKKKKRWHTVYHSQNNVYRVKVNAMWKIHINYLSFNRFLCFICAISLKEWLELHVTRVRDSYQPNKEQLHLSGTSALISPRRFRLRRCYSPTSCVSCSFFSSRPANQQPLGSTVSPRHPDYLYSRRYGNSRRRAKRDVNQPELGECVVFFFQDRSPPPQSYTHPPSPCLGRKLVYASNCWNPKIPNSWHEYCVRGCFQLSDSLYIPSETQRKHILHPN